MGRIKGAKGWCTDGTSACGIDGAMFNTTSGALTVADRLCLQARLISTTHSQPTRFHRLLFSRCVISVLHTDYQHIGPRLPYGFSLLAGNEVIE
jgi:hypothetical protein